MRVLHSVLLIVTLVYSSACQSPPLEPPQGYSGTMPLAMAGQSGRESDPIGERTAGDSSASAGEDEIAGEPMAIDQEVDTTERDLSLQPLDMSIGVEESDMGATSIIDMELEELIDMAPPVELPETCNEPLAEPLADCRPNPLPSTGDLYEDCVRRINQLRAECQCLPVLERWPEGESCADQQAEYDAMNNQAHAGFRDGICGPSGRGQNECPGYQSENQVISLCLQQMWDEGPGEPFIEHGHYINMTNPSHNRVACGFFTTEQGQVWAIQNFSQ